MKNSKPFTHILCEHCNKYRKEAKRFKKKYLEYKEFAEYMAKELMDPMYETNYLAIAELARRRLNKLGLIENSDGFWVRKEKK